MRSSVCKVWSILMAGAVLLPGSFAAESSRKISLSIDKSEGIYKTGETVRLSIRYPGGSSDEKLKIYMFRPDGSLKTDVVPASEKNYAVKLENGAIRFKVSVIGPDGKGKGKAFSASIGVIADPEKIRPGFQEPADFQQFWDKACAELAEIPVKADRREIGVTDEMLQNASSYFSYRVRVRMDEPKSLKGKFRCWDVKVDCIGGVPVSGYLTMPADAKPKSLPAIVSFHGAGVRSANMAFVKGAIRFDVNAHGIENGREASYYRNLAKTTLADYRIRDASSREKYYFRNMYLRVLRALDYVKTLPEYDGKNLIVVGNSQGGGQTLVAAGLDPDVVLIHASVPAMCDYGSILAGRLPIWPRALKLEKGKIADPAQAAALPYFDAAFFARRIKAEAYLTTGLIDTTCSPSSVFAAYNGIPGRKHITVLPLKGHSGTFSPAFVKRVMQIVRKTGEQ